MRSVVLGMVAALCLLAAPAAAQQSAAGAGCADVVRLKNGGFVRGTISEHIPGNHVTVVTAAGETLRFGSDEIERVEPCAPQTTSAPADSTQDATQPGKKPLIVVHGAEARLDLEADVPNVTFMLMTGAATAGVIGAEGFDRICTAPCEASIPSGTYELALSIDDDGDETWIRIEEPVRITGPGVLSAAYEDDSSLRTAGYVTMGAGSGVGLLLVGVGFAGGAASNGEGFPIWSVVIGTVITVASLVTGGVLAAFDDDATVRFTPAPATAP